MKIAINSCYGGFSISEKAVRWLREHDVEWAKDVALPGEHYKDGSGPVEYWFNSFYIDPPFDKSRRADPMLIKCIETLGPEANGGCAEISIIEIPDDIEWQIEEYDGLEHIAEKHRVWS